MPETGETRMRTLPPNAIDVTWSDLADRQVAVCPTCLDHADAYPDSYGWLADWADTHRCDPELAELLAAVLSGNPA
jgi:hypothetical protein